jgi:hypothetical protein
MNMDMPSVAILAIGMAVVAIAAAVLWFVSGQALKLASTSQELLELFEDAALQLRIKPTPAAPGAAKQSTSSTGGRFHNQRVPWQMSERDSAPQARNRWAHV